MIGILTDYTDEYKYDYLIKALNENAIKEKYYSIKNVCEGKITLIENTFYTINFRFFCAHFCQKMANLTSTFCK